jgi:hypothetical protein
MKKYKVTLTPDERQQLQKLITAGKASAKKLAHARILLKADAAKGDPAWSDSCAPYGMIAVFWQRMVGGIRLLWYVR